MNKSEINILVGCEESDKVRGRLEAMGFNAWSCDIQPNRNANAKHYQQDIFEVLNLQNWHCLIAFPPCTHLTRAGAQYWKQKQADGRQQEGIEFFMKLANADIKHIALENPIGIINKVWKKPTQVIQPYFFGNPAQKTTCLWLKNLPPLYHNEKPNLFDPNVTHVDKGAFHEWIDKRTGKKRRNPMWLYEVWKNNRGINKDLRSKMRSETFDGIADAMANQWGQYLIETYNLK
jgi:hypothetical protein